MKSKIPVIRVAVLVGVLVLVLLLYILRLMNFQVVNGAEYEKKINQGWNSTQLIQAARGEILDRNGRPLAMNTVGLDVVFDMAYMQSGSTNEVILRLIEIMEESDEDWIDNLPISRQAPFAFKEGQDGEIAAIKKQFGLGSYATAEDVVANLREKYKLESYSDEDFRKIAGVRYEMERTGFDMSNPYTFATDIKIETVPKVKERGFEIQGVDVVESTLRQYVSGDIAPHIVGRISRIYKDQWDKAVAENGTELVNGMVYTTIGEKKYKMNDSIGVEGSEVAFEKYLKGVDGQRSIVVNNQNEVIGVNDEQLPIPGNTIVLTIDSQLQKVAQDALERQIIRMQNDIVRYPPGKGHEADAGAAAVVDVKTGEILALATYPSYNLTTFQSDYETLVSDPKLPMFNRALMGAYTPGSTFKPVVALSGINEGVINAANTVNCTHIYHRFTTYQPRCLGTHGNINVGNALRVSCNIFFYDVGYRVGIEKISYYAGRLGLGEKTGVELPENIGRMSSPELKEKIHAEGDKQWNEGDVLQASIGQLDSQFSPLQLANYAATLANNGKRMELTLLKSVKNYSLDETIYEHEPKVADTIEADEAFEAIRNGMILASGPSGTALEFNDYPIKIASKTGTPETSEHPNSTFIAYAPADDPEIAVCVVIEKGWHGYTGAPVTKEIFDAYFMLGQTEQEDQDYYDSLIW